MRISDWSSDVCSSDLLRREVVAVARVLLVAAGDVGLEGGGERQQHFRVDRADLATAPRGGAGAAEDHARRGQRVVGDGKVLLAEIAADEQAGAAAAHFEPVVEGDVAERFLGGEVAEIGRASCRERVCPYV